jgi:serine/threonine protein kinase/tetratricopeptide (TPR) repeat protein
MGIKCPKCNNDNPDTLKFCGECGTQIIPSKEIHLTETLETPKEELTTGFTFAGRYQIIEELGKGGMGKVYKAQDTEIKEKVALKLLKPEIAGDKKTIERFQNELRFARKISHRNVCRMYDLNKEEGSYYITMEYVPGEDLKGMIRMMGQLGAGKSISIAKQVCEGLAEAHRLGVVHRDLKPSNIMIDKEGDARIMDFGIARSVKGKGITGAGVMIGTPEYMSPEQAEVKEVDQRSDIYSLGVILYEMVTGRVPFEGETPLGIAMKHKSEAPKDPREINAQIPDDLSKVILRCMEKDKEKRYQSAREVRSELKNIEKGIPTTERVVPKKKPTTSKEITVSFSLKKIFIPTLVFIVLIIAGVIGLKMLPQRQASIAVLPFTDLSQQKDQEYLCDGMTDEIIAKLSRLQGLKVMNMTSVMRYKNSDKDIKEIGRELDVVTILEGRIRKEKDDIRVTAQLINVEDGFQLWTDTYEQRLEGVFTIQSDVAEKIAEALEAKLSPEDKKMLEKKPTEDIEAYNFYLQGRWFWNKRTLKDFQKAIEYFEQAIEKDPDYALAYTGIADSYTLIANYGGFPKLNYPKAEAAAIKALDIDNKLAEAHVSLAYIKMNYYWDLVGAEEEFKLSIELNPNYGTTHHWYALCLGFMARFSEANKEIKRALELNPFSLAINRDVGFILYLAHKYDQAIEALEKAIEMDPNFSASHRYLGMAYSQKSMHDEALKEFQIEQNIRKSAWVDLNVGFIHARMGNIDEAKQILEKFKDEDGILSLHYLTALIYFSLGENDHGFDRLEKAYKEREQPMRMLKVDPLFDNVRPDLRFKALLKKIGLE